MSLLGEHAEIIGARILRAQVIEDGQAIAVVLQEADGTGSAIRISVRQLAD